MCKATTEQRPLYTKRDAKGNEFVVWSPPPATGDEACLGLLGCTEAQLVQDILAGKYSDILCPSN